MNEIIESPKVTLKGLIKVELFDDVTGQKIEEVNTHNFISQGVLRSLFNAKVNDIFTKGRGTNPHEVSSIFLDPFAQISLTSADHPEDPLNEWMRKGKLIGYAHSDSSYVGTDNLRGTYNVAESFTKDEHVRMVFDFPTNAANGEFSSIYFNPKGDTFTIANDIEALRLAVSIEKYKDKYYMLKNNAIEVYDEDFVLLDTHKLIMLGIVDFCIKDDEIYYLKRNISDTITKASILTPSETTRIININGASYFGGMIYDEIENHFIIANYDSSNTILIYYNQSFEKVREESLGGTGVSYGSGVLTMCDGMIFGGNSFLNAKDGFIKISSATICGIIDDVIYFSGHKRPKSYIGSRCLLDVPITKTNQQTMKITYDFKLPSIY